VGDLRITDGATVEGSASVFDGATVSGENTVVRGTAVVKDFSVVTNGGVVDGASPIFDNARVDGGFVSTNVGTFEAPTGIIGNGVVSGGSGDGQPSRLEGSSILSGQGAVLDGGVLSGLSHVQMGCFVQAVSLSSIRIPDEEDSCAPGGGSAKKNKNAKDLDPAEYMAKLNEARALRQMILDRGNKIRRGRNK